MQWRGEEARKWILRDLPQSHVKIDESEGECIHTFQAKPSCDSPWESKAPIHPSHCE